jgi:sugar phosphate isomerase/epimerase
MKLGFVTYQIAKDWDVDTIIEMCQKTGFEGVEPRTTHAHGIEIDLTADQRREVRKKFEDSGIELAGLGSAFEYHAVEADEVKENVEGTIAYSRLAADLGCPGVKVRPNGLQTDKGIPVEKTLEQIGLALRECGAAAADMGVQIRLEVHGRDTSDPANIKTILDHADHDNVLACWNSNFGEVIDGSVRSNFDLLKDRIGLVHITELCSPEYPWQELFGLLKASGYDGFMLAEIPDSPEPERLLKYYRALWEAYTG